MDFNRIYELLEEKYAEYSRSEYFIETDPIQIPKIFDKKEDIEISGFLTASIAWGQRRSIIKNARKLMQAMDYAPYEFICNASEKEMNSISFTHRTFNSYDCAYFIRSIANIYRNHGGLENLFTSAYRESGDMFSAIVRWRQVFTELPAEKRVMRHIPDMTKGSAAKRINMFLRWMVRKDNGNVDFGLWKGIPPSVLLIPLDIHTGNVSRELGLLSRKQNDAKAVYELTGKLRIFDKEDPIKYDFALFGLGAFGRKTSQ